MGPRPHLSLCACKTAWLAPELIVSNGSQTITCGLCACKTAWLRTRNTILYGSQTSPIVLCMQNSVISTRITSLYGSQTFFCILNSDFSPRIASLYGSQPSPVALCMQNSDWLGPELLVSIDPRPHQCRLCHMQNSVINIRTRTASLYWSLALICGFCMQNSVLLDQNYKTQWVPGFSCWFVNAKQRD